MGFLFQFYDDVSTEQFRAKRKGDRTNLSEYFEKEVFMNCTTSDERQECCRKQCFFLMTAIDYLETPDQSPPVELALMKFSLSSELPLGKHTLKLKHCIDEKSLAKSPELLQEALQKEAFHGVPFEDQSGDRCRYLGLRADYTEMLDELLEIVGDSPVFVRSHDFNRVFGAIRWLTDQKDNPLLDERRFICIEDLTIYLMQCFGIEADDKEIQHSLADYSLSAGGVLCDMHREFSVDGSHCAEYICRNAVCSFVSFLQHKLNFDRQQVLNAVSTEDIVDSEPTALCYYPEPSTSGLRNAVNTDDVAGCNFVSDIVLIPENAEPTAVVEHGRVRGDDLMGFGFFNCGDVFPSKSQPAIATNPPEGLLIEVDDKLLSLGIADENYSPNASTTSNVSAVAQPTTTAFQPNKPNTGSGLNNQGLNTNTQQRPASVKPQAMPPSVLARRKAAVVARNAMVVAAADGGGLTPSQRGFGRGLSVDPRRQVRRQDCGSIFGGGQMDKL